MTKQITDKELETLRVRAQHIIAAQPRIIAEIRTALATDFDTPAQRSINRGFEKLGVARFTKAGDDLWEMMMAILNDAEYRRPERRLIDRWAMA